MNLEDFQKSWQTQQAPEQPNKPTALETIAKVKALQQKVVHTNAIMTVVLCATVAAFVFILRPFLNPNTIWYDVGVGIVFVTVLLVTIMQWFKTASWKNRQLDLSSREYVTRAINKYTFLNTTNLKTTPVLMAFILIGINLIYVDIFWNGSFKLRLVMHILLNAVMITIGVVSFYYSKRHNENTYKPVIRELEELQQELEEV
ncbi:hypothetical protein [uncultured Pontibacter sp.]|uniref:hypothetical protein n=1 Tax=uncultured Pontibacter sp. TaxID=453356 RepID=UPI0026197477|nr:hypothetical protein [uncultured Pontibacter sp.]